MAAAHLAALRAVRPKGPYIIGGFCIGGLVAYELAQQIEASGESVEMLLVIDAALEDKVLRALRSLAGAFGALLRWDDHAKVDHFGRWVLWRGRLASMVWTQCAGADSRGLAPRRQSIRSRLCQMLRPRFRRGADPDSLTRRNETLRARANTTCLRRFSGRPHITGRNLITGRWPCSSPTMSSASGRNLSAEWQELAPEVTVHPLIGSHLECITAHVDTLAQTIESCLQERHCKVSSAPMPSRRRLVLQLAKFETETARSIEIALSAGASELMNPC